jgi:A/G-specific adenine glycosylase
MSALAYLATTWFDENARDLPWRHPTTTPWGVLVSEIMLQQTPVNRVEPRWREWLARWPTPAALAADQPADAIRAWGRLGYPRRALRLHECSVAMVARHRGAVPDSLADLLALPGIGAYTARAVAAFAFGQRHPVVDTNVRRLAARVAAGAADGGTATTGRHLALVESMLPAEPAAAARASAAFMELGALVCAARVPRCGSCPLAQQCAWRRAGAPAAVGPPRRGPGYAGTDRQVRGLLLAVLREADRAVPADRLDAVWPDPVQRERALAALVKDGLAAEATKGNWSLPTTPPRDLGP